MLADKKSWRLEAGCRWVDPDLFFPISVSGRGGEEADRAREVCARCPVRSECLDFALRTRQMHGVWGGTTAEERYLLLLEAALIADAASQSA
jgi:WhiB family redox-sensing transcriptional regulator